MKALAASLARHPFVRFALIGGLGYLLAIALLAFYSDALKLDFAAANALTIFTTMIFTWLGNRYVTFRDRRAHGFSGMVQECLKFMGSNSVGAVINYGTALALVHFAPSPFGNKFIAQACGVGVAMMFNFTMASKMVFRKA